MYANFLLGKILVDDDVIKLLGRVPLDLVALHAVNEHGYITEAEAKLNAQAERNPVTITSRYKVNPQNRALGFVRVTTHDGWEQTTVTLEPP